MFTIKPITWVRRWREPNNSSMSPYRTFLPPSNEIVTDNEFDDVLSISTVKMLFEENHSEHHTDSFYCAKNRETLVVRRGQPFHILVYLNRPFIKEKDAITFIFTVADDLKPSPGHGTLVGIIPTFNQGDLGPPNEWGACIEKIENNTLYVMIKPSATASVTLWKIDIDTKLIGLEKSKSISLPIFMYVLFNPWCPDDAVYIPNENECREYVLQDSTLIWRGSYNRMRPSVWKVGQFERYVLECAMKVIATVGHVGAAVRGNPVRVSRALAAVVNSIDDDGILFGNWSEDYSGGIEPIKWTGSVKILQQYYKTQRPVKYAQCWVFAGVLTTVARAIGLPARLVTCYSAAHDTEGSLTIDIFLDENFKKIDNVTRDSVWNYHCWNELWMKRSDLGNDNSMDGWQVVDATPQETSDNIYRVGPAPVTAIKLGEIERPFDCGFVFAEVNADKVYWRYNGPYKPIKMLRKDALTIGQNISTKAIDSWEREDITLNYKFEEKTENERNTMLRALKHTKNLFSRYYLNDNFNDIEFTMDLKEDIVIGESFNVLLNIKNKSTETEHYASIKLNCETVLYTGNNYSDVKMEKFEVKLLPQEEKIVEMNVSFNDYFQKLPSQASFMISCSAQVKDTAYEYYAQDDFRVRLPDIQIEILNDYIKRYQPVDISVKLMNPLPIPLKKGMIFIEAPGLSKMLRFKIDEIPVGGTGMVNFKYTPPNKGPSSILAKFESSTLSDIDGFLPFVVS